MSVQLLTQKHFQNAQRLPFCYLCGQPLPAAKRERSREHVMQTTLFLEADREPALILFAHEECNRKESAYDQEMGQLVGLLNDLRPNEDHNKLSLDVQPAPSGGETLVLTGIDFQAMIRRWLRGFHAALYREPLPSAGAFSTHPPLPSGRMEGDELKPDPIDPAHEKYVEVLKRNRAVNNLDRIICRNGKCRYECVWVRADGGQPWLCVFCLDIYDWIRLGDDNNFIPRGCVGAYARSDGGVPRHASTDSRLIFTVPNKDKHNPFAE